MWDGAALTAAGVATRTLYTWLAGSTLAPCASSDGNLWTCNLTTSAGKQAKVVWVTAKPVIGYPTAGFGKLSRLDGAASATPRLSHHGDD